MDHKDPCTTQFDRDWSDADSNISYQCTRESNFDASTPHRSGAQQGVRELSWANIFCPERNTLSVLHTPSTKRNVVTNDTWPEDSGTASRNDSWECSFSINARTVTQEVTEVYPCVYESLLKVKQKITASHPKHYCCIPH